ncbi:MAG: aminopeptidase [Candidatus Korarchaeota archaeon]
MNSDIIKKVAENIVKSVSIKEDDMVVINAGIHELELVENIVIETFNRGAVPITILTSDKMELNILNAVRADTLQKIPRHLLAAVKETDAFIAVEPFQDPKVVNQFPRDKVAARQLGRTPISRIIFETKRWVYAGWPTKEAADFYGISYSELEEFIIGGMSVEPETLMHTGNAIKKKFSGAEKIRVRDEHGTNFTVSIKDRRVNIDDGILSEEDIKANDLGNNLPAGEVFIPVVETIGDGQLFCPLTIDPFTGKIMHDLTLVFRNGVLDLEKSQVPDELRDTFLKSEEIDIKTYGVAGSRRIGELGIGLNPRIKRAIGYILTDEKVIGSVHLAFGENIGYGGTNKSSLHWDFVTAPLETVEIIFPGERIELLMEKGKLIL